MNSFFKPLHRVIKNPSLVLLITFILSILIIFYFAGNWLMPVIISLIISYLLESIIQKLEGIGLSRIIAISLVFIASFIVISYMIIELLPMLINQSKELLNNIPNYMSLIQHRLSVLPLKFPEYISADDINSLLNNTTSSITKVTQSFLSFRFIASLFAVLTLIIYAVLVPILIFFFLKDKKTILSWLGTFLPKNNQILKDIWSEVDVQIGNYIRGKLIEILIVWILCFVIFTLLGLKYSLLLSVLVGFSVLIPYIGATAVTVPVVILTYMQFDLSATFWWITILYFIIQILDGNVIVPIIFSEAVNIHPTAIIIAILVFGGLWGFWGIFFAIPLATVVKAVLQAWYNYQTDEEF